jgi:hypothetical protein
MAPGSGLLAAPGRDIHAIECQMNSDRFNPECLKVFRSLYPQGRNYLVPRNPGFLRGRFDSLILRITGCRDLMPDLQVGVGREN